ncbi:MAG: hypothetical protein KJO84_05680, partial [Acidimicrobiia bacterium]|nr:hypothetical protein [Acidimicrobiia bacterium]
MRKLLSATLLTAFALTGCEGPSPVQTSLDGPEAVAAGADGAGVSTTGPTVRGMQANPVPRHVVSSRGKLSASRIQEIEDLGGTVVLTHDIGFTIVDGLSDAEAGALLDIRGITDVQPDVTIERDPSAVSLDPVAGGVNAPSDAFFYGLGYQWHMDAIGAPAAWDAGRTGSAGVTVAIIDSGLDDTHADLVGRVDASRSLSFLPAGELDYLIGAFLFPSFPDYADFNSHGTHVGATVASNGVVGAGVTD